MAKYFAGTRALLWGRTSTAVIWQTTVGAPARFDASIIPGCIQIPGPSGAISDPNPPLEGVTIPIGMDAASGSALDVYHHFEALFPSSVANTTSNGRNPWLVWVNIAGQVIARVIGLGNGSAQSSVEIWNGASFAVIGATIASPSAAGLVQIDTRLRCGSDGRLQLWFNGVMVFDQSFNQPAVNNIAQLRIRNGFQSGPIYLSQAAAADFDLRSHKFPSDVLNAAGSFNDGTGTAADTGDGNFTTSKALPAPGNRYSGNHAARTLPGNLSIESVTIGAIMRAGGSAPNARTMMVVDGVAYAAPANIAPAPSSGYEWRGQDWANHPAGGGWNQANYNAAEKGHEARA